MILSTIFAFIVIDGAMQNLDSMDSDITKFRFANSADIKLVDFEYTHKTNAPIEIKIKVVEKFNCGDLYVTIYDSNTRKIISENGFFNQCLTEDKILPIDRKLIERINNPGAYKIKILMYDSEQKNSDFITQKFIVK